MKIVTDINNKILQITNEEIIVEYNSSYLLDENPFEGWDQEKIFNYCYTLEYILDDNNHLPIEKIYPYYETIQ